ncbi:hypothetical protein EJB05_52222, partial [Eragrostis curvula]
MFHNEGFLLTQASALRSLVRRSILTLTGDELKQVRGAMQAYLRPEMVRRHLCKIDGEVRRHIDLNWVGRNTVRVLPLARKLSLGIMCSVVFGQDGVSVTETLAADFATLGNAILSLPVLMAQSVTHLEDQLFHEPRKFDPSRFENHASIPPYCFIPFGGGPRMCPGNEFARAETMVAMHYLVRQFRWKMCYKDEIYKRDPKPMPIFELPVELTLRSRAFPPPNVAGEIPSAKSSLRRLVRLSRCAAAACPEPRRRRRGRRAETTPPPPRACISRRAGQRAGVPFEFHAVARRPGDTVNNTAAADVPGKRHGDAVAVHWLRHAMYDDGAVTRLVRWLDPKVLTLVEQERGGGGHFLDRFVSALHHYSALFDAMGASRPADDDASRHNQQKKLNQIKLVLCKIDALQDWCPAKLVPYKIDARRAGAGRHPVDPRPATAQDGAGRRSSGERDGAGEEGTSVEDGEGERRGAGERPWSAEGEVPPVECQGSRQRRAGDGGADTIHCCN